MPGYSLGVVARWTDANNHLRLTIEGNTGLILPTVTKVVTGTATVIATMPQVADQTWHSLRLTAYASGVGQAFVLTQAGDVVASVTFSASELATGGALATGKPGIIDYNGSGGALLRYFDNVRASVPPPADAALSSGRQAQIRSDGYIRQDPAGAVWSEKTVEGDYLYLPTAGREGRSCQLLLRFCRNDPDVLTDPGGASDQVSGTVYYTPRYRNVPT